MFRTICERNHGIARVIFKRYATFLPTDFNVTSKPHGSYIKGRKFLPGSENEDMPEYLSYAHNANIKAVRFHGDAKNIPKLAQSLRTYIDETLPNYSAILFKNLPIESAFDFNAIINATEYNLMQYVAGISSRDNLVEKVYEASNEPPEVSIDLHNEMSYLSWYPQKIMFCCITPPTFDGETPICFNRELLAQVNPEFVSKVTEKKIRYMRNYANKKHTNYMTWQIIFETESKQRVEEVLRSLNSDWEWHSDETLTSWHIGEAFITHPRTKEQVLFNQIPAFHNSFFYNHPDFLKIPNLSPKQLPFHMCYGDGEEMELDYLNNHRVAQWSLAVGVQWEQGDLLVLDNLLAQHGRMSYQGDRKVVVALVDE